MTTFIAQLSDSHITTGPLGGGPAAGLQLALARVLALDPRPDCVVVTGDLTDHGRPDEYAALREIIGDFPLPLHLTTGNHDDRDAMVAAFTGARLKVLLDFVPNHMGVGGADNPLWLDVLEWGPESAYAGWFDIDWEPHRGYLHDKLLVPVLGDQYGIELDAGRLELKLDEAGVLRWPGDATPNTKEEMKR